MSDNEKLDIPPVIACQDEPRIRVIEGCQHTLPRMTEWADNGACPICLTAEVSMLREAAGSAPKMDERLVMDAVRYRWLRSEETATNPRYYDFWREFNAKLCREEKMDAAIDAAIGSAPKVLQQGETK